MHVPHSAPTERPVGLLATPRDEQRGVQGVKVERGQAVKSSPPEDRDHVVKPPPVTVAGRGTQPCRRKPSEPLLRVFPHCQLRRRCVAGSPSLPPHFVERLGAGSLRLEPSPSALPGPA